MLNKRRNSCPLCFSERVEEFYCQESIPVHVNVIYSTPREAIECRKGDISLTVCHHCGLIFNSQFKGELLEYKKNYDNNQFYSDHYKKYADSIVEILTNTYQINSKKILEVGCGNGEFLRLLCQKSHSSGIGIDPAYRGKKLVDGVSFIADYFNKKYSDIKADVLVLRHVLEHIDAPGNFLANIICNVDAVMELMTVIEVPDFEWISKHGTYWDVTYEHCNYFNKESLKTLHKLSQIQIKDIFKVFSDQYIVAVGSYSQRNASGAEMMALQSVRGNNMANEFVRSVGIRKKEIDSAINKLDGSFTIWGVAGKGVTFINTLEQNIQTRIPFVIDINKKKQGNYCPGTGHKILGPEALQQREDLRGIMIMNPNYYDEISRLLGIYDREFDLISI